MYNEERTEIHHVINTQHHKEKNKQRRSHRQTDQMLKKKKVQILQGHIQSLRRIIKDEQSPALHLERDSDIFHSGATHQSGA